MDAGGRAVFVAADLAASAHVGRDLAAEATAALGGRVDLLVNNAGVYPSGPTAELTDTDLERLLAVNVRAPHVLVAALFPAMAARGDGTIVNGGSWTATVGLPQGALDGATKAAIEQLTRGWAAEVGPRGVRVNAVSPGITLAPGNAGHQHDGKDLPGPAPVDGLVLVPARVDPRCRHGSPGLRHPMNRRRHPAARYERGGVQFTGIVKSFDDDKGCGTIVRDGDRQEVPVSSAGLALGVDSLTEGDSVAFDVALGTDWQARNVMRC